MIWEFINIFNIYLVPSTYQILCNLAGGGGDIKINNLFPRGTHSIHLNKTASLSFLKVPVAFRSSNCYSHLADHLREFVLEPVSYNLV